MKTFSFVIPVYNKYSLLHQCLFDIYQKCSSVDEVIIADNGSTDTDFYAGLDWWKKSDMLPIRHLHIKENVGFLKASNVGMKKAVGDIVCLISNDVRIYKDIVGAIFSSLSDAPSLVGGRFIDWDTGWNQFNDRVFGYLEGWLLATTKDAWNELGYFDEIYTPNDYEDVDLSTKAASLKYELIALPEDMTHHIGGQSIGFNSEREKITLENKEKFRNKWIK